MTNPPSVLVQFARSEGEARVEIWTPSSGPAFVTILRELDGHTAKIAFRADELDRLGEAIAEARRLLLGLPQPKLHDVLKPKTMRGGKA